MSGDIEFLVLEHLRHIRARHDEHGERPGRIELRLSSLETTVAGMQTLSGQMFCWTNPPLATGEFLGWQPGRYFRDWKAGDEC